MQNKKRGNYRSTCNARSYSHACSSAIKNKYIQFYSYLKDRSAVLIHEQHVNHKYRYGNKSFWSEEYYVSTVELNQKTIEKYIREQEADDRIRYIISKREYVEPFKK